MRWRSTRTWRVIAYYATGGTATAAIMEGQEQEEMSKRLQILGSSDLQIEKNGGTQSNQRKCGKTEGKNGDASRH